MRSVVEAQLRRRAVESVLARFREPAPLHLAVENLLTELRGRLLLLLSKDLSDLVPRATRTDVRKPVPRWLRGRRRDDLDCLGVSQRPRERSDATIHFRARAVQSNFRMDRE